MRRTSGMCAYRGVAQFGRALGSGLRGRAFESRHPDSYTRISCLTGSGFLFPIWKTYGQILS